MNTLRDAAPDRLQKSGLEAGQITAAERPDPVYKRILVGTDFSPASTSAFEHALELARQNNAELLVAHSEAIPSWVGFMPPDAYGEWEVQSRLESEKNVVMLVQKARRAGVNAHRLLLEGHADDALIEAAERLGVDLIVIGTHGRRGVSRFFMGSVAAHVVSRAPCTVLTARSSGQTDLNTRRHL